MNDPAFRRAMSRFATCVMVTTTASPAGPLGCTTTAVVSLSVHPPALLVSLNSVSGTLAAIRGRGAFAVNVLATDQQDLVDRFARMAPARRFDGVPHSFWDGIPVLDGAAATVLCRVHESVRMLDHTLVAGTAERTEIRIHEPLVMVDGRSHAPVAIGS